MGFENVEDSAKGLAETLEKDLVALHAEAHNPTDSDVTDWKIKYSTKLMELLSERPDLLALYVQDRSKGLEAVEQELYKEE